MTRDQLIEQIRSKKSFLCIGLDPDFDRMPEVVKSDADPIFSFNKAIIDATHDFCVAYKPNTAFYEARGLDGWRSLERTIQYLNENYPNHFTIADAKRGDIGNTSRMYAEAFLERMGFDSITVAPYMGSDSVGPFLSEGRGKWAIVLALTSNAGASDFQKQKLGGDYLFENVLRTTASWSNPDSLMFVVGATQAESLREVRSIVPDHFLLVPGVGAQGGSLEEVVEHGANKDIGLLINSSRGILYAGSGDDFASKAREEAKKLALSMAIYCR
ncbi:MAG: orotidine-5'-phosphate decarboxylase [Flavobacteriales bacterium]|nr:orotidine-5'-phosphate decarboxylase [Flavobacteriales bacterium]